MKKKILVCLVIAATMSLSVSAIDVYNNRFSMPKHTGTFPDHTVTGGWEYLGAAGITTNGDLMATPPAVEEGQAGYVGWLTAGVDLFRQLIPGPTAGDPDTGYSTTEFTSGTVYTVTWSYKAQYDSSAVKVTNQVMIKNKDAGMGAYNSTLLDDTEGPIQNGYMFMSKSADFTAVSRTNIVIFKGLGPSGNAIITGNITIEEANEKNYSFEFGSTHGWTAEGLCWNGAPVDYGTGFNIAANRDGLYAAISYIGGEPATGTLQSKNFTLPADGYVKFLLGGYSHTTIGPGTDYNYVILCDAVSGAQLGDKIYCPGSTANMTTYSITPPAAYQGTGSNVYVKVVDDSTGAGYAWLSFDKLEIAIDPNRYWIAGAGNWTEEGNWLDGIADSPDAIAHFTNSTAGNVTLASDVAVAEIHSANVNHDLAGSGSLTLFAPGVIDVDTAYTIAATLITSNGLAKIGAGTLEIAADSSFLGNVNLNAGTLNITADIDAGDADSLVIPADGLEVNIDGGSYDCTPWGELRLAFLGAIYTSSGTLNLLNGGIAKCYGLRMGHGNGQPIVNINAGCEVSCARVYQAGGVPHDGELNLDGGTLSDSTEVSTNWIWEMPAVVVDIKSGGGTFNVDNQYREINEAIEGSAGGDMIKTGSAILALNVAPVFDGDINVQAGELRVNCDISGMAGTINVASGAKIGGTGTLGAMTIPTGATIAPGTSIGTLNTGDITMNAGSSIDWEVGDPVLADLLDITGTFTIPAGGMTVNAINDGTPDGSTYMIVQTTGGVIGNASDITMSYGPGVAGPANPTISGNDLVISIVPEPAIIGLLAILGLAFLRRK